jgi:nitrite reductase (NO-forming)
MNGAVDAFTQAHPRRSRVRETMHLFFGVGGSNLISSFHVVGEIFDRVSQACGAHVTPR